MKKLALLLLAALFLSQAAIAEEAVYPRHPALSPDGSSLAFDWRGDVWTVARTGGRAMRITAHDAHDGFAHWSPDGSRIAFMSRRHGNWDIFVMDLADLTPRRLTHHSGDDQISCWSPDGSTLYFDSNRRSRRSQLFAVSAEGGRPWRVIGDDAYNAEISPDVKWIAYQRGFTNWWRKHYRGWASRDIWVRALEGGESFHVVSWNGDDNTPHWSADGEALIFQSERGDGVPNLWRQDILFDDETVAPFGKAVQLTHLAEDGIQYLDLSRDGAWAAFEWKGFLYSVPTRGGEPEKIFIDVPGDLKANALTRERLSRGATEYAFSPGEKQVAFVLQGEIYCALIDDEGELEDAIRITDTNAREKDLAWLDEETLLFVSDRHGGDDIFQVKSNDPDEPLLGKSRKRSTARLTGHEETERAPQPSPDGETILYKRDIGHLWTMAPDGSAQTALVTEGRILHSDWSPDSRYVAYSRTTLGSAEDIFVHEIDGGSTVNVSTHPNDDFHPLWTVDGKRLAWASRDDDGDYQIKFLWLTREEADKSERERERELEQKDKDKDEEDSEEEEPNVEVKIDWEGIPDRVVTVTTLRGYYWDYDQSPDGKHYAIESQGLDGTDLWAIAWDGD
ncbi:PD40 domain-containing protein, partial [bacterium]|nr:PD40 domain-containing protein [bacterium]